MQKIYLVEDDENIRELVSYALASAGYELVSFEDGAPFFEHIQKQLPQLILLDIMLPETDGISILNKLKSFERTRAIPVIMLTAKGGELDRVKGLDFGADDYMTKPFSVLELISRVRAVLRRYDSEAGQAIMIVDGIAIDLNKRIVTVTDKEIKLTFKEFELLHYLAQNKGRVLSRDKIMQQVWGIDVELESRTVDMHIKSLRQKLGKAGHAIKTVWSVGYKMGS